MWIRGPLPCLALAALVVALLAAGPQAARAQASKRVYVADARLAALRARPDLGAPLLKRLRVGRAAYVVGGRRDGEGRSWLRVAVTRRTRGWILAEALAGPGDRAGEARLGALIARLDGIPRLEVARLAVDRFPRLRAAGEAALGEEAAEAAAELGERARRRLGALAGATPEQVRALMLSDPGLDRYNRLGVVFDADPETRTYVPRGVGRSRQ